MRRVCLVLLFFIVRLIIRGVRCRGVGGVVCWDSGESGGGLVVLYGFGTECGRQVIGVLSLTTIGIFF